MSEFPPNNTKNVEEPPQYTEDVLAELDTECSHFSPPVAPEQRSKIHQLLHKKLDRFQNHHIKVLYDEGRVPTFESMQKAVDTAMASLESLHEDEEAQKLSRLLSARVKEIRSWARKYVEVLIRFQRIKKRLPLMEDSERTDAMVRIDTERRRIHDSLLNALTILHQSLQQASEYTDVPMAKEWRPGLEPTETGFAGKYAFIISREAIADRDLIRDWAIVADRIAEINRITGEEK